MFDSQAIPGVKLVEVTLEPGNAKVELDDPSSRNSMVPKLIQAITEAGFEASES